MTRRFQNVVSRPLSFSSFQAFVHSLLTRVMSETRRPTGVRDYENKSIITTKDSVRLDMRARERFSEVDVAQY